MILPKLLQVGLSEREAKIYIAILELGEATIADIVKKAQIKRSTVYDMIELLKQKGLISRFYRQKRQIFCAEDPKKIIEDLEKKKKGMEEVMPELVSIITCWIGSRNCAISKGPAECGRFLKTLCAIRIARF